MLDEPMRVPPARKPEPESESEPAAPVPTTSAATTAPASSPSTPLAPRPRTREQLVALLESCGGNVTLAARRTGRNRKQVYRWMSEHGLDPGAGRTR